MTRFNLEVLDVGPDRHAHVHLALLRGAAVAESLLGGRGLGYMVPRLGRLFRGNDYVVVGIEGGRLKVLMNDPYWMTPLIRTGRYEPEIEAVLRRVLRRDSAFVDAGANIGYWSVFASRLIGEAERVVALEASPVTARLLRDNAHLNGGRFSAVQAAVWSETGEAVEVAIDAARHSWASAEPQVTEVLKNMGFASTEVESITIDDAVEQHVNGPVDIVVVKLDVEGAEERAIHGAAETLSRDALLIYEEHGRSASSGVTRLLMEDLGMQAFILSAAGDPRRLSRSDNLRHLLSDVARGYNLCAARPRTEAHRRLAPVTSGSSA